MLIRQVHNPCVRSLPLFEMTDTGRRTVIRNVLERSGYPSSRKGALNTLTAIYGWGVTIGSVEVSLTPGCSMRVQDGVLMRRGQLNGTVALGYVNLVVAGGRNRQAIGPTPVSPCLLDPSPRTASGGSAYLPPERHAARSHRRYSRT